MRSAPVLLFIAFLALCVGGCGDPPPDPAKVEPPRSLYLEPKTIPGSQVGTRLFHLKVDRPLDCDAPGVMSSATVSWNAVSLGIPAAEIFIREAGASQASARLWTRGSAIGVQKTPVWVRVGMIFELRDPRTKKVVASETVPCG